MKVVIQRVLESSVKVDGKTVGEIGKGMMVLCGFVENDTDEDLDWCAHKVCALRIFDDEAGVMNRPVVETDGGILAISQFTLMASTKKGNRPSYIAAARPEVSIPLYEKFLKLLEAYLGKPVQHGIFGADMKVTLVNDGPVTIVIDTKNRE
jgi:D-tyrosyl-tRNA(Tyr) deacylase